MEPHKDPQQFNFLQALWGSPFLLFVFKGFRKGAGRVFNRLLGEARLDYETKRALDDIGRAASAAATDASKAVARVEEMARENREYLENFRSAVFGSLSDAHEKANSAKLDVAELRGRFEGLEKRIG